MAIIKKTVIYKYNGNKSKLISKRKENELHGKTMIT